MKLNDNFLIKPILFSVLLVVLGYGTGKAAPTTDFKNSLNSTLEDQKEVSVTIYNSNLALIKDIRNLTLKRGISELNFSDVASQIMTQTVSIKSLTSPNLLQVLEQNYEYDLLTPQKLLDKYVGKQIKVLRDGAEVPVTILSTNNGIVYQLGDRIQTDYPGHLIFPGLPENLLSRPTLVLTLDNKNEKSQTVETSYLTAGLSWKADYVAVLNQTDDKLDLNGWVTLDNRSGSTFRNAKLKLVAGDIHRAEGERMLMDYVRAKEANAASPASAFSEHSFFEYHLYSLQRATTIKENESKQVSLLDANDISVKKKYLFYGSQNEYQAYYPKPVLNQKVSVMVEIANKKENRLGVALPKGVIRVYKTDLDGSEQFIGEDNIDHTPKDETIKIKMGEAFDIVADRRQTEWKKIAHNVYDVSFEVVFRNHKDSAVTINDIEPFFGDWEILSRSHEFKKLDSNSVQFDVLVPSNGSSTLQYRARVTY
ncbi:MAG: DUF4139 domain-containing protein [Nitrospirae bacterium]|nr:DUF4139 domain-containing protein [Nitrospirota bacterium]MBI3594158.1 DUF4139 domain-containing protein [Nitrospirota bacterium]